MSQDNTLQRRSFLPLLNTSQARVLATNWANIAPSRPDVSRPTYLTSLHIPPELWEVAHSAGMARMQLKAWRGQAQHENRGADGARIDTEGVLAELLTASLFGPARDFVTVAPLLAFKPEAGVDLTIYGSRVDVKSIGQGRNACTVNYATHHRKRPDYYLLVRLTRADVADVYLIDAAHLDELKPVRWLQGKPLQEGRWFYLLPLPELEPLEPLPTPELVAVL